MGFVIQFFESFNWINIKHTDYRKKSSDWIKSNIRKGSTIGLENIPVYQMIPNLTLKEYYLENEKINQYKYEIINNLRRLPNVVIVSNAEIEENYIKTSFKKKLIKKAKDENYQVSVFQPNWGSMRIFTDKITFYVSGLVPGTGVDIFYRPF
ncbi:MAG: hypothetical protein M1326_10650 [Cyanobacteria bacterium]|nr:hypothetical protein [Cyanobacteriota bacterium]